jgi:Domain of unknown function (DUF4124)
MHQAHAHPSPRRTGMLLCALLLLCAAHGPLHAQWKWKDANGRVTVSDLPPPRGVAEKDILQRPSTKPRSVVATVNPATAAASAAASAPPPAPVDKDLEARKRAAEQEQQAKARAEEEKLGAQRAENCKRARAHQAALDSGQRIARYNDKGEREILDDAGRAAEARRNREVMAAECR